MQHRELGRKLNTSIIASTQPVSLTGQGWRCLSRDAWDEKHHVFFGENPMFFQNTISKLASVTGRQANAFEPARRSQNWVIEEGPCVPVGRAILQTLTGDYPQGVLFIALETSQENMAIEIISQMITQCFLTMELSTLKIIALSSLADSAMGHIGAHFRTSVLTFSTAHLPNSITQELYQMDQQAWLESPAGQKSMESLSWLKKRIDRMKAVKNLKKTEKQRPWLFNILTMGRGSRSQQRMIHPLKKS